MRVLHVHNTGGIAVRLVAALRDMGVDADCIVFGQEFMADAAQVRMDLPRPQPVWRQIRGLQALRGIAPAYDVVHFHSSTMLRLSLDVAVIGRRGQGIVMHYHGMELVRQYDEALSRRVYGSRFEAWRRVEGAVALGVQRRRADHLLATTHHLQRYRPEAQWFPQPLDLEVWAPRSQAKRCGPLVVVHCPSSSRTKGTEHVLRAVDNLRSDGVAVDLRIVQGASEERVRDAMSGADVYVDQLLVGQYGSAAVEAMALGVPTVCHLDPELEAKLPECPIVNASPATLAARLGELAVSPELRAGLGVRSRAYVEQVHDARMLARRLVKLYESCSDG